MQKYIHLYIFSMFLLVPTYIHAENNSTVDIAYNKISTKVLEWSESLDITVSQWLDTDIPNQICETDDTKPNKTKHIDSFFKNNRYLNDTEDIYVRLRLKNDFYSRQDNRMNVGINAQLPFDRCKKKWKFFLQNTNSKSPEVKSTDNSSAGLGIRYTPKEIFGIDASYAIGLSGGAPYVRTRYSHFFEVDSWTIEPIQTFTYSSKYYFEEESNIYFDKYMDDEDLFRIQLHRKSSSIIEGTDYGITFQYYKNLGKDAGFEITQSFFGNTHYNNFYAFDDAYTGINNYVTSFSWRENVWRPWFYYELRPSINFHKDYNYTPSYSIRLILDFYFGEYN